MNFDKEVTALMEMAKTSDLRILLTEALMRIYDQGYSDGHEDGDEYNSYYLGKN